MAQRPAELPPLDGKRLREIHSLLTYESSISFQSQRAHESVWMLYMAAAEPYRNGTLQLDEELPRTPLVPLDLLDTAPPVKPVEL